MEKSSQQSNQSSLSDDDHLLFTKFANFQLQNDSKVIMKSINSEQGDAYLIVIKDGQDKPSISFLIDGVGCINLLYKQIIEAIQDQKLDKINYILLSRNDIEGFTKLLKLIKAHEEGSDQKQQNIFKNSIIVDQAGSQQIIQSNQNQGDQNESEEDIQLSYFKEYNNMLSEFEIKRLYQNGYQIDGNFVGKNILECSPQQFPVCKYPLNSVLPQVIVRCVSQNEFYLDNKMQKQQYEPQNDHERHLISKPSMSFLISAKFFSLYISGNLMSPILNCITKMFKESKTLVRIIQLNLIESYSTKTYELVNTLKPWIILATKLHNQYTGQREETFEDCADRNSERLKFTNTVQKAYLIDSEIIQNQIQQQSFINDTADTSDVKRDQVTIEYKLQDEKFCVAFKENGKEKTIVKFINQEMINAKIKLKPKRFGLSKIWQLSELEPEKYKALSGILNLSDDECEYNKHNKSFKCYQLQNLGNNMIQLADLQVQLSQDYETAESGHVSFKSFENDIIDHNFHLSVLQLEGKQNVKKQNELVFKNTKIQKQLALAIVLSNSLIVNSLKTCQVLKQQYLENAVKLSSDTHSTIELSFQPYNNKIDKKLKVIIPLLKDSFKFQVFDISIEKIDLIQETKFKLISESIENNDKLESFTIRESLQFAGVLKIKGDELKFQISFDFFSSSICISIDSKTLDLKKLFSYFDLDKVYQQIIDLFKFKAIRINQVSLNGYFNELYCIQPTSITIQVEIELKDISFLGSEQIGDQMKGTTFTLKVSVDLIEKKLTSFEINLSQGYVSITKMIQNIAPQIKEIDISEIEVNQLKLSSISVAKKYFQINCTLTRKTIIKQGETKLTTNALSLNIVKKDNYEVYINFYSIIQEKQCLFTLEYNKSKWLLRFKLGSCLSAKDLVKYLPTNEDTKKQIKRFELELSDCKSENSKSKSEFKLNSIIVELTFNQGFDAFSFQSQVSYKANIPIFDLEFGANFDLTAKYRKKQGILFNLLAKNVMMKEFTCDLSIKYDAANSFMEFQMTNLSIPYPKFLQQISKSADETIKKILEDKNIQRIVKSITLSRNNQEWFGSLEIQILQYLNLQIKFGLIVIDPQKNVKKWKYDMKLDSQFIYQKDLDKVIDKALVEKVYKFKGLIQLSYFQDHYFTIVAQADFDNVVLFEIIGYQMKFKDVSLTYVKYEEEMIKLKESTKDKSNYQAIITKLKSYITRMNLFKNKEKILELKGEFIIGKLNFEITLLNLLQKNFEFCGKLNVNKSGQLDMIQVINEFDEQKEDQELNQFIQSFQIQSLQIYGSTESNVIEVSLITRDQQFNLIVFKGDNGKRGIQINLTIQNEKNFQMIEDFKKQDIQAEKFVVYYATQSCQKQNISKGFNFEAVISMDGNIILRTIKQFMLSIDPNFNGVLSVRYEQQSKQYFTGFRGGLQFKVLGILIFELKRFEFSTQRNMFQLQCRLIFSFTDYTIDIILKCTADDFFATLEHQLQTPLKILPGLSITKVGMNASIWPRPKFDMFDFEIIGFIKGYDGQFQICIYPPDPLILGSIPQFMLTFPVGFELKPSSLCSIFFGIEDFPPVLDIIKLVPNSDNKNKQIELIFLGLSNISIYCSLEILFIFKLDIKLQIGIPGGIDIEFKHKPISILNGLLQITDYDETGEGPNIMLKLKPLSYELKIRIDGIAKILGIRAGIKVVVDLKTGAEIKFRLETNIIDKIMFKNDFSLIISPEKPLELKNDMQLKLDLRIPSFNIKIGSLNFDIPQINLFFLNIEVSLKITNHSFYLSGLLQFSIFDVDLNLDFTGENALVIEKCEFYKLPVKIAAKLIEFIPKLILKLAEQFLSLIYQALQKIVKLVGRALKSLYIFGKNLLGFGESYQIENENDKYKQLFKEANELAQRQKYDEAFVKYIEIDEEFQKYKSDNFSTIPIQVCIQQAIDSMKNNILKAKSILYVVTQTILIDKCNEDEENLKEYLKMNPDEQEDNDYFMAISLCLLGHILINDSQKDQSNNKMQQIEGLQKIQKSSKYYPNLLESYYFQYLHIKVDLDKKRDQKVQGQEYQLIWKILQILNCSLNEKEGYKFISINEEKELLTKIAKDQCKLVAEYPQKKACQVFHKVFYPIALHDFIEFYKNQENHIDRATIYELLLYQVKINNDYENYFDLHSYQFEFIKQQIAQQNNKKSSQITDINELNKKETFNQNIGQIGQQNEQLKQQDQNFYNIIKDIEPLQYSDKQQQYYNRQQNLKLKGAWYFYANEDFQSAYKYCNEIIEYQEEQVLQVVTLRGKRNDLLCWNNITFDYKKIKSYAHLRSAQIKMKICPIPDKHRSEAKKYCSQCYKEICLHLDYYLEQNKFEPQYLEFMADFEIIQTIHNNNDQISSHAFEILPKESIYNIDDPIQEQEIIQKTFNHYKKNQNLDYPYLNLVKKLNQCKRNFHIINEVKLFIQNYRRYNPNLISEIIQLIEIHSNIRLLTLASYNFQLQIRDLYEKTNNRIFLQNSQQHLNSILTLVRENINKYEPQSQPELFKQSVIEYFEAVEEYIRSEYVKIIVNKPELITDSNNRPLFTVIMDIQQKNMKNYKSSTKIFQDKIDKINDLIQKIKDDLSDQKDYMLLNVLKGLLIFNDNNKENKSNSEILEQRSKILSKNNHGQQQIQNEGFSFIQQQNRFNLQHYLDENYEINQIEEDNKNFINQEQSHQNLILDDIQLQQNHENKSIENIDQQSNEDLYVLNDEAFDEEFLLQQAIKMSLLQEEYKDQQIDIKNDFKMMRDNSNLLKQSSDLFQNQNFQDQDQNNYDSDEENLRKATELSLQQDQVVNNADEEAYNEVFEDEDEELAFATALSLSLSQK